MWLMKFLIFLLKFEDDDDLENENKFIKAVYNDEFNFATIAPPLKYPFFLARTIMFLGYFNTFPVSHKHNSFEKAAI